MLSSQEARGDKCSIEQPAGRASWKLGVTHDFRQAYLAWTWCRFPSCAYFMKHHAMGEHWEKMQELCAQCLFGVNTPPTRMHCSAWAHRGQHPGRASAWRVLHHRRWRIPATHVHLIGSDCVEARARSLSTASPTRGHHGHRCGGAFVLCERHLCAHTVGAGCICHGLDLR